MHIQVKYPLFEILRTRNVLDYTTMGKGLRVVKRYNRDKPIWVVIHICMETTQGISLYSYFYLKVAKMPCFLIIFFSSTKLENKGAK
jgi:hypothetical protein